MRIKIISIDNKCKSIQFNPQTLFSMIVIIDKLSLGFGSAPEHTHVSHLIYDAKLMIMTFGA